eukprot:TRINITY_DN13587_c0_g1_i1.p1 TRINITY_DN13587_c0_g1~~TRINITY_DN13587_c0_g1_i1.p1  ORF type:complete len:115 (+),score=20.44 TRINITY_DN13587_c0_g1_i1:113-457(+)
MDPKREEAMEKEIEEILRGKFEVEFEFVESRELLDELWDMGLRYYDDIEKPIVSEELRNKLQEMMSRYYFELSYADFLKHQEEVILTLPPISPEMELLREKAMKYISENDCDWF